jgi:hypothetical protein
VGVSTDVLAQALPVTEFIHGEPEPVVVGPLQPLPFLTVNELVPLDQSMPPDLKVQASPEVREKSRQHFDFLLNIFLSALWLPLLLFSYRSHQRLDFV